METALYTALFAGAVAAIGSFAVNWLIEGRKRLLDLRAKAYDDFLGAMAMPETSPEEIRQKSALVLGAKARAALFGGGAVVDAMRALPAKPDEKTFGTLLEAMRNELVRTVEERRDGPALFRAVFGPQDRLRQLPTSVGKDTPEA